MELIWDGERDSGSRAAALIAALQSREPPAGVHVFLEDSRIEISTRSAWAFATWAVSALMIWFGRTSDNWFLLALSPFMGAAAIMQSLGVIGILIGDEQLTVFEGIAGIGRRIRMPLRGIQRVEYKAKHGRGGSTGWIVLHNANRHVKFGRHLNDEQIEFVIAFLLDSSQSLAA